MKKDLTLKLFGPPKVVFNQKDYSVFFFEDGGLALLFSGHGPSQP